MMKDAQKVMEELGKRSSWVETYRNAPNWHPTEEVSYATTLAGVEDAVDLYRPKHGGLVWRMADGSLLGHGGGPYTTDYHLPVHRDWPGRIESTSIGWVNGLQVDVDPEGWSA